MASSNSGNHGLQYVQMLTLLQILVPFTHLFRRSSAKAAAQSTPNGTAGPHSCPYHANVLAMNSNTTSKGLTPMQRFLSEGATEQSALFVRPDTGELSISKGCTCGGKTEANP
ncbi:hypothetical protein BU26DRAFT_518703 [Trematosphaeria pertusa]|uniref:Uncharacterized protein n=1 Tax=Trematosphaeria pertusa TaxID=390896 RepID=A0A6A6ILC6_9PLEO|nr:uncharacterized protein BU26DRAFT_518703 [Trematosphaeria pertusa]KAF2250293.1 hypothetical protein BU26DRAFT_518703 [Trematosphaeria pertusa]